MKIVYSLVFLSLAGVLALQSSPALAQGELSVELSANPSSWQAPLYDVDLTVQTSGNAAEMAEELTYRFDCTNDGVFEKVAVTSALTYIAFNVCDYPNPGTYTARVEVSAGGFTVSDTALISVGPASTPPPPPPAPTLSVVLSANPSSGTAPLNDVDLTAQVSGSATGSISYRFDCRDDGSYEQVTDTNTTTLVASNLCDYVSPGVYIAKVIVVRQGVSASDTVTITVNPVPSPSPAPTLFVTLSAIPSSGTAPLNDVDLKADVTGTATGNVNYRFDCTNNGPYESEDTVSTVSFTKADLCDYTSAGTYTARVLVMRGGLTAQDTVNITVSAGQTLAATATFSVVLTPIPFSGTAPLNDVDMKADVAGTATGDIDYRFDCTNNGPYEFETIVSSTSFTKADLCDYPTEGTYTARVFARRAGITAQDTATITVSASPTPTPTPTLFVSLSAIPSSGTAPLNDVDLKADVSGTATGAITYKFDCTNDGVFESSNIETSPTFTKAGLCDFTSAGVYTAKVVANRGGLSSQNTALVVVNPASLPITPSPTLFVTLNAIPSSGTAPLNDVDLKADVTGTAIGNITYRFDCTNDGIFESEDIIGAEGFTKVDLCDYPSQGTYTARVFVARNGISAQNVASVTVGASPTPPPPPPSPSPSPASGPTLVVNLFADPNSGTAPLKGVDLNASVGGSAVGDITYQFDCTKDGLIERVATTSDSTFNARDLCSYPAEGTYTALVRVTRMGLSAENTAEVRVVPSAFALNIAALGRNKTEGETSWNDPVFAKPSDRVEFQIFVSSEGNRTMNGVVLRGTLPPRIAFAGELRVDGILSAASLANGIPLGSLEVGQTKTITFEGLIIGEEQFAIGLEDLTASFVAVNPEQAVTDTVTVQVVRRGVLGATNVPTGLLSSMTLALFGTLAILFLIWFAYFLSFYLRNRSLLFAFKSRAEQELIHIIAKIRRSERI